jgi:Flp pilus assembly protein TadD
MVKKQTIRAPLQAVAAIAATLIAALATNGCGSKADEEALSSGMEALRAGDNRKAADLLAVVLRKHPENATAQANLGLALWRSGRERQAVDPLRTASVLVPDDPRPKLMLGMVLMELNLLDDARARLQEARAIAPASPEILTALGAVDIRRQKYAEAESWLQQALRQKADYPPALYNMGMLFRTGKPDPAKSSEYLRKYLVVAGQDPHAEAARRILDLPPGEGKPPRTGAAAPRSTAAANEARTAFDLGVKHQAEGRTQAAVTAYKHALALDPKHAKAAYNLGLLHKAGGQTDEAAAMFRQAAESQPKMTDAHYMLAVLANEAGRTAEAQQRLETVLDLDPNYPRAHFLSGMVCVEKNQPSGAAKHFEKFLRLAPNDSLAPGARAWLETHRKRTAEGTTPP